MNEIIPFFIVAALILINGILVAAEFAIVCVPRASIYRLVTAGDETAKRIQQILKEPKHLDRYIATAQTGITISSLGLGMYGEATLAEKLQVLFHAAGVYKVIAAHSVASVLAVVFLTYFHILLGEMIPKIIALQYSERTVLKVTEPIIWLQAFLYPLVVALTVCGNFVLKLLGIKRHISVSHYHTPDELQYIIEESYESGLLPEESGKIVRDIFSFQGMTVQDLALPRIYIKGVELGITPGEIKKILETSLHTRYPVYRNNLDDIIGQVHLKDLLKLLHENRPLQRGDIRPIPFIPSCIAIDAALAILRENQTQTAVVLDEYGGTSGLLSIADLFHEVIPPFEESVSEFQTIRTDSDGNMRANGTLRLDKLSHYFKTPFKKLGVHTLSGLILSLLNRAPEIGDIVTFNDFTFKIIDIEGHGVKECIIYPKKPMESAGVKPVPKEIPGSSP